MENVINTDFHEIVDFIKRCIIAVFIERSFYINGRTIPVGGPKPQLKPGETLLRRTSSLCPECYRLLPAIIFEREGKVWIRRICPTHGEIEEVYWSDYNMYVESMKYETPMTKVRKEHTQRELEYPCPFSCGLCPIHQTYTMLANVVVTNRCDLSCWYCLPGDQEVLVRINEEVRLLTLDELSEGMKFSYKVDVNGIHGEYAIPKALEVLSYDEGKARWKKVTKFFRRKYDGIIYTIRTRTGREIKVTPEHMIIVVSNDKLVKKEARYLKIGDEVLVVRKIPRAKGKLTNVDVIKAFSHIPEHYRRKIYVHNIGHSLTRDLIRGMRRYYGDHVYLWRCEDSIPLEVYYEYKLNQKTHMVTLGLDATSYRISSIIKLTPELCKLIGYFIADGHYTQKDIRITAGDHEILEELFSIAEKHKVPYSIMVKPGKAPQVAIGGRLLRLIFKYIFEIPERAPNKRLPKQIFQLPTRLQCALLSGMFNGDGYIIGNKECPSIGYATTSSKLARELIYLLISFGIFPYIRKVPKDKIKLAKHDLYKVEVYGKNVKKLMSILDLRSKHRKRLSHKKHRIRNRLKIHGDFIVDKVVSISKEMYNNGYVYDLEVESDSHTFIVNDGILVSNCFFYSEKAGYVYEPTLEQLREMFKEFRRQYPYGGRAVQLTGGEPLLRDDIVEIVKIAKEEGIKHVQLNTNGLRFISDNGVTLAKQLREAGVNTVYMSFDGISPKINFKNHWEMPYILENFRKASMTSVVLVPTVINNWNTDELGAIVKFAANNMDIIRGVNFQPVSLTGRMPREERIKARVTIPDVIKLIEKQTDGQIGRDAWYPVPVTFPISKFIEAFTGKPQFHMTVHPACGKATYVYVKRDSKGLVEEFIPITEFVDVKGFLEYLSEKAEEISQGKNRYLVGLKVLKNIWKFIDSEKQPKDVNLKKMLFKIFVLHNYKALAEFHYKFLYLGMMHFMDLYNYDVQRVQHCGIHYLNPDGRIIPFCTYNVLSDMYRDDILRRYSLPIDLWVKLKGRKGIGEAIKYKRNIKKLEGTEIYWKHYEPFKEYL